MIEALGTLLGRADLLLALALAVPLGLAFGCVPGLGGKIALIALMPLTFGMDTAVGCVFLIALHAVVHTGGAVPAILFAVPGTGPSTAVVMDGHALARQGEGRRAIAASSIASAIGGVVGAVCLAALVPFALVVLKAVSYPETFVLSLFAIGVAATLGGRSPLRGAAAGCLGLAISFVGTAPVDGSLRFTGGLPLLWDGVDLVTAVLAIFAIPEMIALAARPSTGATEARAARATRRQTRAGLRDVVDHRGLTVRTSLLGTLIGFIPGLGGDAAAWMCYGHAARTSRNPDRFGHGAIDGVIGPEAANNAKEGGALAPTLLLGLPGSSGMAVLLVAFEPLGIAPGPALTLGAADLLWLMVWALVLANLLAAAMLIALTPALTRISRLDGPVLAPVVLLLCLVSVQLSSQAPGFFVVAAALGLIGYAMQQAGWPRAPFVIGLVMGPVAEDALVKSLALWGADFLLRPGTLLLIALLVVGALRLRRVVRTAPDLQ